MYFAVYYNDEKFSTRLALNYKGEYVQDHGANANEDEYYGKNKSIDWSTSYTFNEHFMVYAEVNNLSNEALLYYIGDEARPTQFEYYGRRGQIGFKYTY